MSRNNQNLLHDPLISTLAQPVHWLKNTRSHEESTREIIKRLERISGEHPREIFRDWLTLVEAGLTSPNDLAESLDTLTQKYHADYLPEFISAMEILRASTEHGYYDVIGWVYMQYAFPNPGTGQYFTPWSVAKMMGMMTIPDGKQEILNRLQRAAEKAVEEKPALDVLLKVGTLMAGTLGDSDYFLEKFLPEVMPYYEPLTVCDPCVGSGVMLLGAADQFPGWAVHLGLVQFYGQDIDPDCVKMAKINILLYGLNGSRGKYLFNADALQVGNSLTDALPAPARDFYNAAREAKQRGDNEAVQAFIDEANRVRQEMVTGLPLFADAAPDTLLPVPAETPPQPAEAYV